MPADRSAEKFGLHARLVDEIFRRASAEHDRGRTRSSDNQICRLDDVANDVDVPGTWSLVASLRQSHSDGRIGDGGTENRHAGTVGCGQNSVLLRFFPEVPAETIQKRSE